MGNWIIFKECKRAGEALMAAEFLESNDITVKVQIDEPLPGLVNSAVVLVQESDEERARNLYAQQEALSEQELSEISSKMKREDES